MQDRLHMVRRSHWRRVSGGVYRRKSMRWAAGFRSFTGSRLRAASLSSQVIVSTQSVTLVNQLSPEDVIVVDRAGGQSVFQRFEKEPLQGWLAEYAMGELWEKKVLGGRP